ncbi:MAG TPA: hypothetical protein VNH18_33145 [Bryobacteraceae bacterium]|nr:hypothetical protein [Bryobacteraceae bacterium]
MASADDFLRGWVNQLETMQQCMNDVNTDTDPDLLKFSAQKHGDLLLTPMIRTTFIATFQDKTNIAINEDHFAGCASFRELLDRCYRPLQLAVVIVMRAAAVANDPTLAEITEPKFGTVAASRALPGVVLAGLMVRLQGAMSPLFQTGAAAEARVRDAIGKPGATVGSAALAVL